MRCPTCDHIEDRVVDSRLSRGGRAIRRRRECIACGQRFTTYELVEREPLTVRKSSGAIEPYDRHKLLRSIRIACAKRPVSLTEIEDMVADGSTVAVRYTETGTSRAPFFGAEPTGKSFSVSAMEWFSIRDGKIYEWRGARDSAALRRQIR